MDGNNSTDLHSVTAVRGPGTGRRRRLWSAVFSSVTVLVGMLRIGEQSCQAEVKRKPVGAGLGRLLVPAATLSSANVERCCDPAASLPSASSEKQFAHVVKTKRTSREEKRSRQAAQRERERRAARGHSDALAAQRRRAARQTDRVRNDSP